MTHPYIDRPDTSYWRTGVSDRGGFGLTGLWQPRFPITSDSVIITFGSCFAQNISRRLVTRGYRWLDAEPVPDHTPDEIKAKYNYGVFSCRTGNIYTTRMLRQWLEFAFGEAVPMIAPLERNGRYYDPYRQQIEQEGFGSVEELEAAREMTLSGLRDAFSRADVFIFTLGLTEAWLDRASGQEYSMCPGPVAGQFNEDQTAFVNHRFEDIVADFSSSLQLINRDRRSNIRVLLTVSPVPLTATATSDHVLLATTYSKSVLRAAAGDLVQNFDGVDYFPSFDLITAPISRGMHYASNMRQVTQDGVDHVMSYFFEGIDAPITPAVPGTIPNKSADNEVDDVSCDEVILDAFAKKA